MSFVRDMLFGLAVLAPTLVLAQSLTPDPVQEPAKPGVENRDASGSPPAVPSLQKSDQASGPQAVQETLPPNQGGLPADASAAVAAAVAYLDAVKAGGFAAAPTLLHPQALERFKRQVLPRLQQEQARGNRALLNATFGRDATLSAAQSADPADFMSRCARVIVARDPELAPRFSTAVPIGTIREGDRVHVLVRLGGSGAGDEGRLEVVSVQRDGKTWKVLLDRRIEEIAQALGSSGRSGERQPPRARMEPMPEGVSPMPLAPPQAPPGGAAGLPTKPGSSAPTR